MKHICLTCIFLLCLTPAGADEPAAGFSGPLWSRSTFIPASLYFQFQGLPAAVPAPGNFRLGLTLYCAQTCIVYEEDAVPDPVLHPLIDFETLTLEHRASWTIAEGVELGATVRLVLLYGGFLDPVIHNFHLLFGFPLNGRDVIPMHRVFISLPNENGRSLELDRPAFGLGDTDLWAKFRLFRTAPLALSALCALKLPTGNRSLLLGSGYPDLAAGLLFDWYVSDSMALYLNAGIVIPWDAVDPAAPSRPFLMAGSLVALEWRATGTLSFIAQFELRTTPLVSGEYKVPDTDIDFLGVPQTNILLGASLALGDWTLQFHFREDLFTHNSEDIAFNLSVFWNIAAE